MRFPGGAPVCVWMCCGSQAEEAPELKTAIVDFMNSWDSQAATLTIQLLIIFCCEKANQQKQNRKIKIHVINSNSLHKIYINCIISIINISSILLHLTADFWIPTPSSWPWGPRGSFNSFASVVADMGMELIVMVMSRALDEKPNIISVSPFPLDLDLKPYS